MPQTKKEMPKILLYITAKVIWNFLFWNTDYNENRAHDAQAKEVLDIAKKYQEKLLSQWSLFKQGKPVRIIKVKKTK